MASSKKGITPDQFCQLSKKLNLTVAEIAEGTRLSKAYISEFRNETRNLSDTQHANLRKFLEGKCEEQGLDYPDDAGPVAPDDVAQDIGGMVERLRLPAIVLSGDVPKAQFDQFTDLIEANRLKVAALLGQDFQNGGMFGGDFSPETEDAIRQIFALLALNYLAILVLQGRNIARRLPDDYAPKTMGDWLSQYLTASPLAPLLDALHEVDDAAGAVA